MKRFSIITAMDIERGIMKDGNVPWYLPSDLDNFAEITLKSENTERQNAIIMDADAWRNYDLGLRPLTGRINVIIGEIEDEELSDEVLIFPNLEHALEALSKSEKIEGVFVIGGVKLFENALMHPSLERIYLTRIDENYECDVFFPDLIPAEFEVILVSEMLEDNELFYQNYVLEKGKESDL